MRHKPEGYSFYHYYYFGNVQYMTLQYILKCNKRPKLTICFGTSFSVPSIFLIPQWCFLTVTSHRGYNTLTVWYVWCCIFLYFHSYSSGLMQSYVPGMHMETMHGGISEKGHFHLKQHEKDYREHNSYQHWSFLEFFLIYFLFFFRRPNEHFLGHAGESARGWLETT